VKEEIIRGSLRGGYAPSLKILSPSPYQGEGDKGDGVAKQFQIAQVEEYPVISYNQL